MEIGKMYLAENEKSWADVAHRVAQIVPPSHQQETEQAIADMLFVPSSPILRNAGARQNMLSCHDLGVTDNVAGIWQTAADMAQVFKSGGGGIGVDLSELSAFGTPLKYAKDTSYEPGNVFGISTGPVSFADLYRSTGRILGGGISGKAPGIMMTLNASHPDAARFIMMKNDSNRWLWLKSRVEAGKLPMSADDWELICSLVETQTWGRVNLTVTVDTGPDSVKPEIWRLICENACKWADPGIGFIDNMNAQNPVRHIYGDMTTFNICGENPDYRNGGCVLGSLRLPALIQNLGDYSELERVVKIAIRLLDSTVEINHYPTDAIREQTQKLKRVGLGVSGWDTLLQKFSIPFVSGMAFYLVEQVAKTIRSAADKATKELGQELGEYMPGSNRRNVTTLAIAPNGHIALLPPACSASIYRNLYDVDGYRDTLQMTPEQHIEHVGAWQDHVDGGISYTVSLPNTATWQTVDEVYRRSYERGLKAMSIYRDGSLPGQPCKVDGTCSI